LHAAWHALVRPFLQKRLLFAPVLDVHMRFFLGEHTQSSWALFEVEEIHGA
jgi:hypothetical protein